MLHDQATELRALVAKQKHVEACYSFTAGLLVRENGRTRPIDMDELEQTYTQASLDLVMENAGQWVMIVGPKPVAEVA